MKRSRNLSLLVFVLFLLVVFITFSVISVEARKNGIKKSKPHNKHHQKDKSGNGHISGSPGPAPAPLPHYGSNPTQSTIFDVLSFGAKGDGVSDDSKVKTNAIKR